jgi:hypothetical protein
MMHGVNMKTIILSLFGFASFQNVIYKLHSMEDRFLCDRLSFNWPRNFSLFMETKRQFSSTPEAVDSMFLQILSLSSTKLHGVIYQKIRNLNMYHHCNLFLLIAVSPTASPHLPQWSLDDYRPHLYILFLQNPAISRPFFCCRSCCHRIRETLIIFTVRSS